MFDTAISFGKNGLILQYLAIIWLTGIWLAFWVHAMRLLSA